MKTEFFSYIIGISNSSIIGIATRSLLRRVVYEVIASKSTLLNGDLVAIPII